jgi:hypothetical protein
MEKPMTTNRILLIALAALIPAGLEAQLSNPPQQVSALPLASHPQGQAMMAEAVRRAALLDITFTFLDKEYQDDTYATDPFGNKYRTGCYRFKVHSGFRFKVDQPQFTLTNAGLTVTQNISKITADGLAAKAQVLACHDLSIGVGLRLSDVKVTYTARPVISISQSNGACTIGWNQDIDDLRVSIGDVNVLGVQNDIDKLSKKAAEEAVNFTLDTFLGSMMRNELIKVSVGVCGQPKTRSR